MQIQEQLEKINNIWENCPQLSHVIVLDESDSSENERIINFKEFLDIGDRFDQGSEDSFEDLIKIGWKNIQLFFLQAALMVYILLIYLGIQINIIFQKQIYIIIWLVVIIRWGITKNQSDY